MECNGIPLKTFVSRESRGRNLRDVPVRWRDEPDSIRSVLQLLLSCGQCLLRLLRLERPLGGGGHGVSGIRVTAWGLGEHLYEPSQGPEASHQRGAGSIGEEPASEGPGLEGRLQLRLPIVGPGPLAVGVVDPRDPEEVESDGPGVVGSKPDLSRPLAQASLEPEVVVMT